MNSTSSTKSKQRLLALDIMRGITIAGMIMVNNSGGPDTFAPLKHATWNGLTPTDLVFPFFMFIMGISTYISLRKYNFKPTLPVLWKILRRTIVIFAIGIALAWLGMFMSGILVNGQTLAEATLTFDHIRILGVLPRLALCYGIGSIFALFVSHRHLPWFILSLLVIYAVIIVVGSGYEINEENVLLIVDRAVLGENHMYLSMIDGKLPPDPEGVLSTIPSIAHMLIGFWCGMLIMSTKDNYERITYLFLVGTVLTFAGLLLSYGFPINKKIWSPTFVLTTCGLASLLLGLLIWIIDIKGYRSWCRFFQVFGVNPLALYCLSVVLAYTFGCIRFQSDLGPDGIISVKKWIYYAVMVPLGGGNTYFGACFYAIFFVLCNWIVGLPLYLKKIYIKI